MFAFRKIAVSLTNDWWKRPLLFLFLFFIFEKAVFFLLSLFSYTPSPFFISAILLFSVLISSFLIEKIRPNSDIRYLGFFYDNFIRKNFVFVVIISLVTFFLIALIILVSGSSPATNPDFNLFAAIVLSIQIFIMAFYEEIIFRGVIFQSMIERFGEILPTIILSLIFALFHLYNPHISFLSFINIFFAGIVFSIIFIQTRSLSIVIIYHFLWNFFQAVLIGWNVSGMHYSQSIFIFHRETLPHFIDGGNFGLEATPILTLFLLIHSYFFMKYLKKSPFVSSLLLKREYGEPE